MKNFMRKWLKAGFYLLMAAIPFAASGADYPTRTVRLIVPFSAGGGTDVLARKVAAEISTIMGGTVIVENKPGATGVIAINDVKAAAPDGYTLFITHSAVITLNPLRYEKPPYSPKDLLPVVEVSRGQQALIVGTAVPAKDLKGFVEYAKAQGDKMAFASWGLGTASHYAGEYLNKLAGLKMIHVPYAGAAPVSQAVMGNQVAAGFVDPATASAMRKTGKLQVLAVAGENRSPALPDVPTFKELGMPEMAPFGGSISIFAPLGTPPEVCAKITDAVRKTIRRDDIAAWMNEGGFVPAGRSGTELASSIDQEISNWERVLTAIGVQKQQY